MQDSFDITTLIFIVLAVFVIWRLRSVLGQKTGSEQPPFDPLSRRDAPLRPATHPPSRITMWCACPAPPGPSHRRGRPVRALEGHRRARHAHGRAPSTASCALEPSFDPSEFLEGAKSAYEMIVTAFAQGDRKTLKDLLSREVYEGFERAITERERRGEKVETTFVSIDKAEIAGAELQGKTAQIVVRFLSKLITATRDASGSVVDGSPEAVVRRHRRVDLRPLLRQPRPQLAARRDRSGAMRHVGRALLACSFLWTLSMSAAAGSALEAQARLEPVPFAELAGWAKDDHAAAFRPSCAPAGRSTPVPLHYARRRHRRRIFSPSAARR